MIFFYYILTYVQKWRAPSPLGERSPCLMPVASRGLEGPKQEGAGGPESLGQRWLPEAARAEATNTAVCGCCGRTAWKPAALSATASARWSPVPQLAFGPSPSRGRWCRSSRHRYTGGHPWARARSSSDPFLSAHSACRWFCSLFRGWSWYPHWCRQSPSLLSSRLIEQGEGEVGGEKERERDWEVFSH